MNLTKEQFQELGLALNESTWLGLEVRTPDRVAGALFDVLTLLEQGQSSDDNRVHFVFKRVGRIAASLREGHWDDLTAKVTPFTVEQLLSVVQSFGGQPIYGWEFFDKHEEDFPTWADRLSLDWRSGSNGLSHSITLFQAGQNRHLDVCLWFDEFLITDPQGNIIPLDEFIAGGRRWWDGLYSGDERTSGHGIFPG